MRLNAKILKNVAGVNNWQYVNQATIQEGQINEIYLQLVDYDKTPGVEKSSVLPDFPLRYIPQGTTIALEASFPSIDDAAVFAVAGTQPFADDKSIWKFTLTSSQIPKSGNFKLKLTEDGADRQILVRNSIIVDLLNVGSC
jgi:hypothetical protein